MYVNVKHTRIGNKFRCGSTPWNFQNRESVVSHLYRSVINWILRTFIKAHRELGWFLKSGSSSPIAIELGLNVICSRWNKHLGDINDRYYYKYVYTRFLVLHWKGIFRFDIITKLWIRFNQMEFIQNVIKAFVCEVFCDSHGILFDRNIERGCIIKISNNKQMTSVSVSLFMKTAI